MRFLPSLRLVLALFAAVLAAGCDSEALLGAPEQMWLWGAAPFLGFLIIGGALIGGVRGAQLRNWDLRKARSDQGARGIVTTIFVLALLLAAGFLLYNLPLQIDPRQKGLNALLWFLGSVAGALLGTVIGLRMAEPASLPESERS